LPTRKRARRAFPDSPVASAPYRVFRDLLPNGLRLSTVETPHLHSAVVALYVRAGARYESPATNGLSHFVEHMLFRGSARFPTSFLLNRAIEERGGTLYAETGRDYSLYHVALRPSEVGAAMDILGDLFSAPTFRDIELERPIVLEEILEDLDDKGRNVNIHDISRSLIWQGHPLGYSVIGPAANVRRFTTTDVRRHFRRFYGARNMALCVAGKVDRDQIRGLAGRAFAEVPGGQRVEPPVVPKSLGGPQIKFVADEGSQVQLQLVFRAFPEWDPAFPSLAVLMRLLDDGMSTPLHYRVCDQKGLAYQISGGLEPLHDAALFEVDGACSPSNLVPLVEEILAILDGLRRSPPEEGELDRAKRRYVGDLEAGFDDLDSLCGWFGGTELFFRPHSHLERARRVQRVTGKSVLEAAQRVLRPEGMTFVAVGNVTADVRLGVRRALRTFGPA